MFAAHTSRITSFGLLLLGLVLLLGLAFLVPASEAAPATGISYKITTTDTGIYEVTHADLTAAGFDPTGINTNTFQLFNFGQEVVIFIQDGGDGFFDSGDSFLFYAEEKLTRYTDYSVYWFVAGETTRLPETTQVGTPGAAPAAAGFMNTLHFEEDKVYKSGLPMTDDKADRWYWQSFSACTNPRTCQDIDGFKNARTFTLDAPAASTTVPTATLTAVLRGSSNEFLSPDHRLVVSVNAVVVNSEPSGYSSFEGMGQFTGQYDFPSSLLISGSNVVLLEFPVIQTGITNAGYVNYFELSYPADFVAQAGALGFGGDDPGLHQFSVTDFPDGNIVVLDVSDPKNPVWISGASVSGAGPFAVTFEADNGVVGGADYFAASSTVLLTPASVIEDTPSDLRATDQGVDYLIITHSAFITPSQQLADYRTAANGFRTMVVDVQDVYDEFNGGVMDPNAIRDFIRYVSHFWEKPKLQYVVLMGDGHYDFRNYLGSNEPIYIPPWLAAVDSFQGETAADNRYADIYGDEQYDSDAGVDHVVSDIVVKGGHMVLTVDFGYKPNTLAAQTAAATAPNETNLVKAIGNMVFWDEDLDGIWDAHERGVPGVTVNLWQGGSIVDTQVTDEEGGYYFEDKTGSATYTVEFIKPAGWSFTTKDVDDPDPFDIFDAPDDLIKESPYDSDADPVTGFTVPITYTYPETVKGNWDAGIVRPGTIGNRVWEDLNGDGLQYNNEPGIGGVLVELLQAGSVISTTTTDADGYFYFYDLPDGVYDVRVAASNFSGVLANHSLSPQDQGFDTMPDLALGRFPVNLVYDPNSDGIAPFSYIPSGTVQYSEADEMVNRTINYESNSTPGAWQKRVIFIADETDPAGNFYEHSNEVADHIWPYPAESMKVYHQLNYANSTLMKAAIIQGINEGALFVTYNGHSSKSEWGSGDQFFTREDIDSLSSGNEVFPVFLPMTCLEGQYINPGFVSMGEKAVRTPGKGAVVSFSPTGLGVAIGHQFLYNAFFEGVVAGQSNLIGDLTQIAKDNLFQSHSGFKDLLDTYVLFGDPALAVQMAGSDPGIVKTVEPSTVVAPGTTITYTLTYSNSGAITANNVVITDILPSELINPVVSSDPDLSAAVIPGPDYSWFVGDLAPGAGGVITITATINPGQPDSTQIVNTARIDTSTEDTNLLNNQSTVTTDVGASITLGGVAWYDVNANHAIDGTELTRIPGIAITIMHSGGATYTTATLGDGSWSYGGLPGGTYTVTAGTSPGLALITTNPLTPTVLAGGSNMNLNFGYLAPTAVTIAAFEAELQANSVIVTWQTRFEENMLGYYVYRSAAEIDHGKRISSLIASTNNTEGDVYTFKDTGVKEPGWYYWLQAVSIDGGSEFIGPILTPDPGGSGSTDKVYLGLILR